MALFLWRKIKKKLNNISILFKKHNGNDKIGLRKKYANGIKHDKRRKNKDKYVMN